jgi:hypothetical protein
MTEIPASKEIENSQVRSDSSFAPQRALARLPRAVKAVGRLLGGGKQHSE